MSNIFLLKNNILNGKGFKSNNTYFRKHVFYDFSFEKPWFYNKDFKKFDFLNRKKNIWFYNKKKKIASHYKNNLIFKYNQRELLGRSKGKKRIN